MAFQYGTFEQSNGRGHNERCSPQTFASELSARLERELAQSQRKAVVQRFNHKRSGHSTGSSSPSEQERCLPEAQQVKRSGWWKARFLEDVAADGFLRAQLLLLTFATGTLDAVTFSTYSVFVSKQTGNTVSAGLWAMGHPHVELEENIGTSLIFFVFGAVVFGHLAHLFRPRRRIWLISNMAIQAILVYVAAAIAYFVSEVHTGLVALITIAILSFSSGGQMALAVNCNIAEINTTLITGAMMQLATDRNLFKRQNPARTRRLLFILLFFMGAVAGAAATKLVRPSLGMLLDASMKTVACVSFFYNPGDGSTVLSGPKGILPP